jgi:hypothetical protein
MVDGLSTFRAVWHRARSSGVALSVGPSLDLVFVPCVDPLRYSKGSKKTPRIVGIAKLPRIVARQLSSFVRSIEGMLRSSLRGCSAGSLCGAGVRPSAVSLDDGRRGCAPRSTRTGKKGIAGGHRGIGHGVVDQSTFARLALRTNCFAVARSSIVVRSAVERTVLDLLYSRSSFATSPIERTVRPPFLPVTRAVAKPQSGINNHLVVGSRPSANVSAAHGKASGRAPVPACWPDS